MPGEARFVAQLWFVPVVRQEGVVKLTDGVSFERVGVRKLNGEVFPATLLQVESEQQNLDEPSDRAFRTLGRTLARISFLTLQPHQVFSARLIPLGVPVGKDVTLFAYPGEPPGISLDFSFVSRRDSPLITDELLSGGDHEVAERAIGWLTLGQRETNPIQKFIMYWIGLECLAPMLSGSWTCQKCSQQVSVCPHCNASTVGPKAVRRIQDYMRKTLGVAKADFDELYELRGKMSHGSFTIAPEFIDKVFTATTKVERLLIDGIKLALGRSHFETPNLPVNGDLVMSGVLGLNLTTKVMTDDFYSQPTILPA